MMGLAAVAPGLIKHSGAQFEQEPASSPCLLEPCLMSKRMERSAKAFLKTASGHVDNHQARQRIQTWLSSAARNGAYILLLLT